MSQELEKFDPNTLADRLRQRIKDSIADLIPQEQWDVMLKKELEGFFNAKIDGRSWSSDGHLTPSVFSSAVRDVIGDTLKIQLKAFFDQPDYQPMWKNGFFDPSSAIKKMAIECAGPIMENFISQAMQMFVQDVRSRLMSLNIPR